MAMARTGTGSSKGNKRPFRSSGNFLAELPSIDDFEQLIECPVCKDLPLPPIYQCQTGHIVCSKCRVKLNDCSECKKPYTTTRNFLLESIAEACKYYCNNQNSGCNITGKIEQLKIHHENCEFRFSPAKCFLAGVDEHKCDGELHYLPNKYLDHLTVCHELKKVPFTSGKPNTFRCLYSFRDWDNVNWNEDVCDSWNNDLFRFDEKFFVTRTFRRGSKFFFQLAIIADAKDGYSAKYIVKVSIQKGYNQYPKCQLEFRVPSIREFASNDIQANQGESSGAGEYEAVTKEFLEKIGQRIGTGTKEESKFEWNVDYELKKDTNYNY